MGVPAAQELDLSEGVLREPTLGRDHLVLWLPGSRHGGFRLWERISNVLGAEVSTEDGLCASPAVVMQAREHVRGPLSRLWQRLRRGGREDVWQLPTGAPVEPWGEKQSGWLLVWAEAPKQPPDEARIRSRWPNCSRAQRLGANLFLVQGTVTRGVAGPADEAPSPSGTRQLAARALAAARQAGDRRAEALALADLGVIARQDGDAGQALAHLEAAWVIAAALADTALHADVLGNLGLAALAAGLPAKAHELFERELTCASARADPFAESIALDHLGTLYTSTRDTAQAIHWLEKALALARQTGQRSHEAGLLWSLGVQYAERGEPDRAEAFAQAAVDILAQMGSPHAAGYAEYLERYRVATRKTDAKARQTTRMGSGTAVAPGPVAMTGWVAVGAGPHSSEPPVAAPRLLRMAVAAVKSMVRFMGTAMQVATPDVRRTRLQACAACRHHTGVRCRLCGCFTTVKARMAHESCPIGKWPA